MDPQRKQHITHRMLLIALGIIALISGVLILLGFSRFTFENSFMVIEGVVLTVCAVLLAYFWVDPDTVRAQQTEEMLNLSSKTLSLIDEGIDEKTAQQICTLLLPSMRANAVAITDRKKILGYVGVDSEHNPIDAPIHTEATHKTIADGKTRVLRSAEEIGFPYHTDKIHAAIIVALHQSGKTIGALKFYYARPRLINDTQFSIAKGFGDLLSTQIAASALDEQKKLATSMELKALQSQINPHFLYNTINTIASFIRTDPSKARVLLREFATFYRSTLEDDSDLIALERELEQTQRYLHFEIARFGEERLNLTCDVPDDLKDILVPSFLIQPLVENSVKHAMRPEGCLHICVSATRNGDDLTLKISDDGVGMSDEQAAAITNARSSKGSSAGLGMAIKNIHDRVHNYYGDESYMHVTSKIGEGTCVTLFLKDACSKSTYERFIHINHVSVESLARSNSEKDDDELRGHSDVHHLLKRSVRETRDGNNDSEREEQEHEEWEHGEYEHKPGEHHALQDDAHLEGKICVTPAAQGIRPHIIVVKDHSDSEAESDASSTESSSD